MSQHASGTFTIDAWEPEPYDDQNEVKLARVRVRKTFSGDIAGVSTAELLMVAGTEEGQAAYVGVERIVGSVHGRAGSFVLLHHGIATPGEQSALWTVAPGSGTGGLRSLRGTAIIGDDPEGAHSFTLDYDDLD
ncbi:MAG TPA: DUF3224 domain-containing protein [Ktedonobacterales bacterium]